MKMQCILMGLILFIILQSPSILAIDCSKISSMNKATCQEILESDLSTSEKETLISNLDYSDQTSPDHDLVLDSNLNLEITSPPNGIQTQSKTYIKNAWIDILSLMQSVLYNNYLYVPEKTSVLTGFNYDLELPENYYSSSSSQTKNGDCQTKYYLLEEESENKVYVNGQYVDSGRLVDLTISKDSKIESVFSIYVEIKIKHYEWEKSCVSRREDGSCKKYKKTCEYDSTETKKESLELRDSINIKKYSSDLTTRIIPLNGYSDLSNINLEFNESVKLSFDNSYYNYYKYIYSLNYSKAPYYILTLQAEDYNQEEFSNLFKTSKGLTISNSSNCQIESFDFFSSKTSSCEVNSNNLNLYIKTDKLSYKEGEEIQVEIFPKDILVSLEYNNQTYNTRGKFTLKAVKNSNQIIARFENIKAEKIIYISNNTRLILLWNLGIFTFLNYCLIIVLKKYSEKIK